MNVKNSAAGEFKRSPAPIEAGVQGVPSGTQAALPSSFPESDENLSREIPDDLLTPIWSGRAGCASGTQAALPPLSGTDEDLSREIPDDLLTPIWSGRAGCASGTQAALPPLSGTDRDLLREVPDDLLLRSVRACRVCLQAPFLFSIAEKKFSNYHEQIKFR